MATKATLKPKAKKPLKTTLGKGTEHAETCPDLSHLRKPIDTSLFGLKEVLSLFETATGEVKHYLRYECDLMYECRMCRTIFRSLANFILHKRNYCPESYNPNDHTNCRNNCLRNGYFVSKVDDLNASSDEEVPVEEIQTKVSEGKKNISSVLKKLLKKQDDTNMSDDVLKQDLSKEPPKKYNNTETQNDLATEKIPTSESGVFQTMFHNMAQEHGKTEEMDYMRNEVMELHGLLSEDEAVLGPDGKILASETEKANRKQSIPKGRLVCGVCNQKFSTRKTLTYHVKYKHNDTRIVYPCPICKDQFANAWCVFRHLYKIHRKTTTQIRKMRDQIHASAFRKDQEPARRKNALAFLGNGSQEKTDCENQWMEDIERDNDLQMCGGCGRRFERKAALHSHSQLCLKRIAVCNTIKENAKQVQEEKTKAASKESASRATSQLKGSGRRKPQVVRRKYKTPEASEKDEETKAEEIKESVSSSMASEDDEVIVSSDSKTTGENSEDEVVESSCTKADEICDITIKEADVLNIIGVTSPNNTKQTDETTNEPKEPTEKETENSDENVISIHDSGSEDEEEDSHDTNLISTLESALREIDSICSGTVEETSVKKRTYDLKDQSPASNRESKIQKICEFNETGENTLLVKAKDHVNVDTLRCLPCDVQFNSLFNLVDHMSLHFNWYCFQCSKCTFMSYHKEACVIHARSYHQIDQPLMDNTVLPVPNWKTIMMSTDFKNLLSVLNETMHFSESGEESVVISDDVKDEITIDDHKIELDFDIDEKTEETAVKTETTVVEAETTVIENKENKCANDVLNTSDVTPSAERNEEANTNDPSKEVRYDPHIRDMIMEIIVGNQVPASSIPPEVAENTEQVNAAPVVENSRPVRNRVKSVKTVQEDFLYDMRQILKTNDYLTAKCRTKKSDTSDGKGGRQLKVYTRKLSNGKAKVVDLKNGKAD